MEACEIITRGGVNIPARRSLAQSDLMFELPPENAGLYYESLDNQEALPVPSPPAYNEIESVTLRYLGQIMANELAPEDGLNAVHDEISAILAR